MNANLVLIHWYYCYVNLHSVGLVSLTEKRILWFRWWWDVAGIMPPGYWTLIFFYWLSVNQIKHTQYKANFCWISNAAMIKYKGNILNVDKGEVGLHNIYQKARCYWVREKCYKPLGELLQIKGEPWLCMRGRSVIIPFCVKCKIHLHVLSSYYCKVYSQPSSNWL